MMEIKEQRSLHADIRDADGRQTVMLHVSYGEKMMNLTVEVLDKAYVTQNASSVSADVAAFFEAVCQRAANDCALPTGEVVRRTTSPSEQDTASPGVACDEGSSAQAESVKAG
ncbi:MAG: hypothetical protein U0J65_05720 [Christensenellales bacterium]|nr:hypothetical protein [Christensenellales bacterium]